MSGTPKSPEKNPMLKSENDKKGTGSMSRKKKIINNTSFPDYAIEAFARSIWPDLLAFFESEEGQKEYEAWRQEQAKLKAQNANNEA